MSCSIIEDVNGKSLPENETFSKMQQVLFINIKWQEQTFKVEEVYFLTVHKWTIPQGTSVHLFQKWRLHTNLLIFNRIKMRTWRT